MPTFWPCPRDDTIAPGVPGGGGNTRSGYNQVGIQRHITGSHLCERGGARILCEQQSKSN